MRFPSIVLGCCALLGACTSTPTTPPPGSTDDTTASHTTIAPAGNARDNLIPRHGLHYPTRLAEGPKGRIYVTDARIGSVFVYDQRLQRIGELKKLDRPLGIAVDANGRIYVGTRRSVEVYTNGGALIRRIDAGGLQMPNDLAFDRGGNLYVADSRANQVKVYGPDGVLLRTIGELGAGEGQLRFPSAVTIAYRVHPVEGEVGELFVADQRNYRVQVFDLAGNFLRAFGSQVRAFSDDWKGRFVAVQGLAVDEQYRLHALDSYLNRVQILNADNGELIAHYGSPDADAPLRLLLPLDILIGTNGKAIITNAERHEVVHVDF